MQEERKEEMKFFSVTCSGVLCVLGGKSKVQGRKGKLTAALTDAQGRQKGIPLQAEKAGREILCFSGHQEALLGLVQHSHALSFPTLGKIISPPCSSWAVLGFLVPEAVSRSSFLKLEEH